MARSESGPEKMNANGGAESLSWCFDDFMFQQQGHSLPSPSMGWPLKTK